MPPSMPACKLGTLVSFPARILGAKLSCEPVPACNFRHPARGHGVISHAQLAKEPSSLAMPVCTRVCSQARTMGTSNTRVLAIDGGHSRSTLLKLSSGRIDAIRSSRISATRDEDRGGKTSVDTTTRLVQRDEGCPLFASLSAVQSTCSMQHLSIQVLERMCQCQLLPVQ